jgi:diguanylate cyclase (GGDEF)-like protein
MTIKLLSRLQKVELLKEIANHPKIPSPPTVVLRVLDKASAPDCTIADLCTIIQVDPGLAGRILRIVNSATFGLSRPVASIQRALAVVGLNSARLLVLTISFPEMQRKTGTVDGRWAQNYWNASVAGAIVARELSKKNHARDPEDDMAAALLRDLGELILQQLFPEAYQLVLAEPADTLIDGQCEVEDAHCGLDHAEVSAFILDRWRLPAEITEAIRHHHHPEGVTFTSPAARERAYLLHFATRAAQLLRHPDKPPVLKHLLDIAQSQFHMSEPELHAFLLPLSQKIADFAGLLQVDIGEFHDYEAVLARAGEELVSLTVSTNLDNQRATEKTRRAESEARRWKQEAVFDSLTKVFNRRFLESKLREFLARSKDDPAPFGLVFLDLDGFKPLNDRFGHPFGDLVLQKVADCLGRQVRQGDIVARYGGDEFCIFSESIGEEGLQALCRRVRQHIGDLTITLGPHEGKIGVSIGAVLGQAAAHWDGPESLLTAADQAMYQAKSQGKNRVVFWQAPDRALDACPRTALEGS